MNGNPAPGWHVILADEDEFTIYHERGEWCEDEECEFYHAKNPIKLLP
jgi:hypothetical protein